MNYELAKKLKDAGFPFQLWDGIGEYQEPTLSELIAACGEDFHSLELHLPTTWIAHFRFRTSGVRGESPEIAVARLWLALKEGEITSAK